MSETSKFTTTVDRDAFVITIEGEFNQRDTEQFNRITSEAMDKGFRNFIVDLDKAAGMDSSGASTLVALHKKLKRIRGELILLNVYGRVRTTLEFTRLHRFFVILYNYDEAFAIFKKILDSGKQQNTPENPTPD